MVQLDQTPSRVRLVELELGSIKPHQDVWKYFFHPGMALDISELKRLVALRSCHPELLLGILDYVDCPRLEWLEIECLHASQTFYLGRISDVLSPVTHLALNYDIDARLGSEYAANNLLQGLVTLNGCRIEELTVFMSGYATQWTSLLKNLKSDMNIASDFYILDELLVRIIQIPGIHKVRVRAPRTWFDADGTSRPINDEANEGLELIMTKTRLDALLPNASRQGLHAGKLTVSYFDEEMIVDPVQRGGFSMWSFQD
ncbi:hypothetical protein VKT23_016198 [Stygiomarasmius scandens]|uniref:Uncharacterized protein n=1 Tax=Marasmiellus scandens TaxID=2682957 RepID=A0ABR1IXQ7_9AGAR